MVMAEIIGPLLVHQLPLHNRRGGVGQPSLVMNHHHIDCLSGGHEILHAANLNISKNFHLYPSQQSVTVFSIII